MTAAARSTACRSASSSGVRRAAEPGQMEIGIRVQIPADGEGSADGRLRCGRRSRKAAQRAPRDRHAAGRGELSASRSPSRWPPAPIGCVSPSRTPQGASAPLSKTVRAELAAMGPIRRGRSADVVERRRRAGAVPEFPSPEDLPAAAKTLNASLELLPDGRRGGPPTSWSSWRSDLQGSRRPSSGSCRRRTTAGCGVRKPSSPSIASRRAPTPSRRPCWSTARWSGRRRRRSETMTVRRSPLGRRADSGGGKESRDGLSSASRSGAYEILEPSWWTDTGRSSEIAPQVGANRQSANACSTRWSQAVSAARTMKRCGALPT